MRRSSVFSWLILRIRSTTTIAKTDDQHKKNRHLEINWTSNVLDNISNIKKYISFICFMAGTFIVMIIIIKYYTWITLQLYFETFFSVHCAVFAGRVVRCEYTYIHSNHSKHSVSNCYLSLLLPPSYFAVLQIYARYKITLAHILFWVEYDIVLIESRHWRPQCW